VVVGASAGGFRVAGTARRPARQRPGRGPHLRRRHGAVLVQDPVGAGYPAVPRAALVIAITDRPGLEAVARDCYRLIRDEFDELATGS
jgi:hypothetical protein